jgi:ketosteroid isomerase-like protein
MKKYLLIIPIVICIAAVLVMGQNAKQKNDREGEIRRIDLAEADAILRNDAAAAQAFYSDGIVVNNPRYTVTNGKQALMALIKTGNIHYSSFVREIETISFQGETAIVMGKETVKPDANAPGAGQTILRRYTNIWMERNGKWLLIARHANIICTN